MSDHELTVTKRKPKTAASDSSQPKLNDSVIHDTNADMKQQKGPKDFEPELHHHRGREWTHDIYNMAVLVLLYFIQGIPMGLSFGSLPFLLQDHVSYTQLGVFSFAAYPYSLKLFWSPIVDSIYNRKIGRRKSWILPIQTLCGLFMLFLSTRIEDLVKQGKITSLTVACFFLILLAATQDIAVDGWALTMLSKENVSFASTCQSLGLTSGFFVSFTIFLALNNADFCASYIAPWISLGESGIAITLGEFMKFSGILYLVVTVFLIFFKREEDSQGSTGETEKAIQQAVASSEETDSRITVAVQTYKQLWYLLQRKTILKLALVLLIGKVAFATHDNVTALKLLERGFPKQSLALMAVIQLPFEIAGTILVGKWSRGHEPLAPYLLGMKLRLALCFVAVFIVYYFPTEYIQDHHGNLPLGFYLLILGLSILYQFSSDALMFVSMGAFFARISDDNIGGSYMTLLNTISNFGGTWPKFFILWLMDQITVRSPQDSSIIEYDGYYLCSVLSVILGSFIYFYVARQLRKLEQVHDDHWKVN